MKEEAYTNELLGVHRNHVQSFLEYKIGYKVRVQHSFSKTHKVLIALIQSISTLKSPGPDFAPGTPPSAFTESDIPRTRDGFISKLASMTLPLHVGKYRARGI